MATTVASWASKTTRQEFIFHDLFSGCVFLAGLRGLYCSRVGLSDAVVHFWQDHRFDFQRPRRRGGFHGDDLLARYSSAFIERRIARRHHIDPGFVTRFPA